MNYEYKKMSRMNCTSCNKEITRSNSLTRLTLFYREEYGVYLCMECRERLLEEELKRLAKLKGGKK